MPRQRRDLVTDDLKAETDPLPRCSDEFVSPASQPMVNFPKAQ